MPGRAEHNSLSSAINDLALPSKVGNVVDQSFTAAKWDTLKAGARDVLGKANTLKGVAGMGAANGERADALALGASDFEDFVDKSREEWDGRADGEPAGWTNNMTALENAKDAMRRVLGEFDNDLDANPA